MGTSMIAISTLPAFAVVTVVACEIIDHALMNALISALHLAADRVHALWLRRSPVILQFMQVQTCAGTCRCRQSACRRRPAQLHAGLL